MFEGVFGHKEKGEQDGPLMQEKVRYGGDIDPGDLISALKEHDLKGINFDPKEHTITYPRAQRIKIEAVLRELGVPMDEEKGTLH